MLRPLINAILVLFSWTLFSGAATAQEKPNFLIIVVDDLGWSDPGFLGSSINTPSIDQLAARGAFLSNFYVAPTCSPTRSMLLTGVSNHAAGVGTMRGLQAPNQLGQLEYGAQLHEGVVTLAEVLQADGYATAMSGKWHLAIDEDQHPSNRGFDRSFGLLEGGASHFSDQKPIHRAEPVTYLENGAPVDLAPEFYSSYAYTDKMLEYLKASGDQPFFAYLAYTAPHDPLQVPDDWIDRYDGTFDAGPEQEISQRTARLVELGLLPSDAKPPQHTAPPAFLFGRDIPWVDRDDEARDINARRMEIYASMVEIVDQQIGRVLEALEATGKLDNTYVLFMSDNGASAGTVFSYPANDRDWVNQNFELAPGQMGKPGSFTTMGREWTHSSNTPFSLFKATVGEGGVRSPLIIAGPGIQAGSTHHSPSHVTDITPTLQALAGINAATNQIYSGKLQPQGRSLLPVLQTAEADQERAIFAELFGNRMVRSGKWKALSVNPPLGSGDWELYDIVSDPGASTNLAIEQSGVLDELVQAYAQYAEQNNVIAPDPILRPSLMSFYDGPCSGWCKAKFGFAEAMMNPVKRAILIFLVLGLLLSIGFILARRLFAKRA
ncbi:MAG: arylsulfatase [Henriciella sp.]